MGFLLDQDFIWVLLRSDTFVEIMLTWGIALVVLVFSALWLAHRNLRGLSLRRLHVDVSGMASAVDFVLTFPIFLIILLFVIQLMIMLNSALIVHYAAYSAARSARVWMWDSDPWRLGAVVGDSLDRLTRSPILKANRSDEVKKRVERAAQFALIAASPADERIPSSPEVVPESILRKMAQEAGQAARADVLLRKAKYAFDPQNSRVEFEVETGRERLGVLLDLTKPGDAWATTARVSFRIHLGIPVARFLGFDRGDGHYYRPVTGEVTLL